MDKSEIRSLLFQLDRARRRLMQPYFTALGLPLGQGQPRILTRLLEGDGLTSGCWRRRAAWTPPPSPVPWTGWRRLDLSPGRATRTAAGPIWSVSREAGTRTEAVEAVSGRGGYPLPGVQRQGAGGPGGGPSPGC